MSKIVDWYIIFGISYTVYDINQSEMAKATEIVKSNMTEIVKRNIQASVNVGYKQYAPEVSDLNIDIFSWAAVILVISVDVSAWASNGIKNSCLILTEFLNINYII